MALLVSVSARSAHSYFTGSTSGSALPFSTWLSDGMTMGVGGLLAHAVVITVVIANMNRLEILILLRFLCNESFSDRASSQS